MILVEKLVKTFGSHVAVAGVSFEIPAGQVAAFLGPNGAGKTTTIRTITGYHPPTAGRVVVGGWDVVTASRAVRRRIGYLPESTPLYTEMRVDEYLAYRGRLFGLARPERVIAVDRVVERCWLSDVRRRPIGQLSKGYRQRVGLAAALLHEPPVLILDEPTAGLDPTQIRATRRLIRELAGDHTMLLSTHILPEAQLVCDRVIIIAQGSIKADGAPDELIAEHRISTACIVQCYQPGSAVEQLRAFGDVTETMQGDGWTVLRIMPREPADIREGVARLLRSESVLVRELRSEAISLEHVFVHLTSTDDNDVGDPEETMRE
ncbi:MAG: ATP-binding cassette domain-containing protein [Phycisphaerales bacterium]|nr:ATP-binding cassette domain-containing protein [Phycisphaerales bacterium]